MGHLAGIDRFLKCLLTSSFRKSFSILNEVSLDITNCLGRNIDKERNYLTQQYLFKLQITKSSNLKKVHWWVLQR